MEGSLVAYKVFTNGSVLNASEINENLMNQSVMVFSNSTTRAAALTAPVEGMLTWLEDINKYENYNGTAWVPLGGGILQVQSVTKTDTFVSGSVSTATSTPVTGLSVTITPSSTSSKILVQASVSGASSTTDYGTILMRGGVALAAATGDLVGLRSRLTSIANTNVTSPILFLDSPATVSALTYSINIFNPSASSQTLYVNRQSSDSSAATTMRSISTITVSELA